MTWAWVRPADEQVLTARPLLDVGVGDAMTLTSLASTGRTIGVDVSVATLAAARRRTQAPLVAAEATALPFTPATFRVVLCADLLHHLGADALTAALEEAGRVLVPGGHLVAWWYGAAGRPGPGSPRYPRPYEEVSEVARRQGLAPEALALRAEPPADRLTVGMLARRADGR